MPSHGKPLQSPLAVTSLPKCPSMSDPRHKRVGPGELADIVNGIWESQPDSAWALQRIQRMKVVGRRPTEGQVEPGTLAYARKPSRFSRRFEARVKGSSDVVLMVGEDEPAFQASCPVLRVKDAVEAANAVARAYRDEFAGPVVAVTGSMGKTTVSSMISMVLSQQHRVFSPRSDLNGISPIRARTLQLGDEDVAIFEVPRAALPGAEKVLGPDVAIVTGIAEAHMEALGSLVNTATTKAALLGGIRDHGTAIVNIDAPHSDILLAAARERPVNVITYGLSESADVRLLDYEPRSRTVVASFGGREYSWEIGASGRHNALNSLAVFGTLSALGLDIQGSLNELAHFGAVKGRGQLSEVSISGRTLTLVDQTFNANPASMRAALDDFAEQFRGNRILALGDMLELGDREEELHRELVPAIVGSAPTRVYLVGRLMTQVWTELPEELRGAHVMTAEQLVAVLRQDVVEDTAILLKASHGTGLHRVVEGLQSAE